MNEINIHHGIPTQAIRFDVWVDDTPIATHVIGDGVIISTPRGSGGYFSSITRRTFAQGLGIAFNNPKRAIGPHLVSENSLIRVKILRGPALLCADNDRKTFRLTEGDQVAIRKSDQVARLIEMDGLRQIDWRSTKPAKRS
jgi:NAD+ kinase